MRKWIWGTADAFARAQATAVSAARRSRENNGWWLAALSDDLSAARVADLAGSVDRLKAMRPDAVRAAASRYLTPAHSFAGNVPPTPTAPASKEPTK